MSVTVNLFVLHHQKVINFDPENITALFLFRFGKHCCFLLLLIRIDVNATNCSASLSIPDYPACLSGETDCVLLQTPIFI
jgi:hypothetical protein